MDISIEKEKRQTKNSLGTIEYTERHISAFSLVAITLALGLFFFCSYFYFQNENPLLLLVIILCAQFFFKYLDNVPSKIWKLYQDNDKKEEELDN